MLSNHEDNDNIAQARASGADGYAFKSGSHQALMDAIMAVLEGGQEFVTPKTSQSKIIQNQGYYISHGKRDPDIAGITVPILGRDRELIGVISLSGLTRRFTDENIESFLEALMSTSKKVCLAFGSK